MRKSKASLFLMELIIVIFFFALTSAICLRVFVKAHEIADTTEGMNKAVLWAENAGELFYEYGEDQDAIEDALYTSFHESGYAYLLNFHEDEQFLYMDYSFRNTAKDRELYSFTFRINRKEVR